VSDRSRLCGRFGTDGIGPSWDYRNRSRIDYRIGLAQRGASLFAWAIRNLLENAVKYSPDCRTVWVDGSVIHRQATISVRDRGMGIEPREQREIFQKFVRGAAAKKAGIKCTGIGLSMVQQIVDACGGEIRLESAAGQDVGATGPGIIAISWHTLSLQTASPVC